MPQFLDTSDPDFEPRFAALLARKREADAEVDAEVAAILADVAARGDAAVIEMTARWDRLQLTPATLAFSAAEIDAATASVGAEDRAALELAAARIRAYHERQLPPEARWTDAAGAELGWRWTPVDAAGLYVPGGTASYPSSLLMNAIPARVAGVRRLVVCVPTPDGAVNPLVLLAARLAGIDTVYRIGGAQAIAALAYGTATIPAVDKITGPGNAWVAAAKARVFGRVGIDMIAGPSEVVILADAGNDPDWLALDLLAQAEHDAAAQAILVTDDAAFGRAVAAAVEARLATLARRDIAGASWRDHGAVVTVGDWGEAAALADRIAPEHLQVCTARRRGAGRPRPPCRRHLHRRPHPRGDRRLCGRAEPRAADRALGPLLLRPLGAGLHEAHHHLAHDAGHARRHRPRRRAARPLRGARGARPLDPRPARPAE